MNLKVLAVIILYWSLFFIITGLTDSVTGNPLSTDYTTSGELNESGFSADDEVDSGGFFAVLGVFTALGRFFAFALFGFTTVLTGLPQVLFTAWQSGWTLFTIGFLVDSVWSG